MFLSFNGGKDCTVLLELIVQHIRQQGLSESRLSCWYIEPETDAFEEVEQFVFSCEAHYRIKINRIRGKQIKEVLATICEQNPMLEACIMGSRRTDPYCGDLNAFQKTDPGWPELMRVSPILDWTCDNIWDFIRGNSIPYCPLYDFGYEIVIFASYICAQVKMLSFLCICYRYTSLGNQNNTSPNPFLQYDLDPDTGRASYHPAYCLREADHLERAGRGDKKSEQSFLLDS